MADTLVLEASAFGVGVQVPPAAPFFIFPSQFCGLLKVMEERYV